MTLAMERSDKDDSSGGNKKADGESSNTSVADDGSSCSKMDPIVEAACNLVIFSTFGDSSGTSYRPIGPSADTAFSGSVVLELEVKSLGAEAAENAVLKHSSVRSLHPSFDTQEARSENSKKYAAAIKIDKSSRNESAFLGAYWERLLTENSNKTRIPRVLFARDHPTEGVTLLLESLTSFGKNGSSVRIDEIPLGPRTEASLEWLANFHAAFLPKSLNPNAFDPLPPPSNAETDATTATELTPSSFLWSVGTHLSLEKRSPAELRDLATDLAIFVDRFEGEHEYFRTGREAREQGRRIQAVAEGVAATLHPDNNPIHCTMVHGDYKQGNMFFDDAQDNTREGSPEDKPANDCNGDEIAVFDWQWTGPGIGATDLVYLCVMAVSDEALGDYEANILKPYHTYLLQALNRGHNNSDKSKFSDYPYETLVNEFKLAAIDIQRWMGGSRYRSMTPESVRRAQKNVDVNHGIFRRSIERLVWIFRTVDEALDQIESGKIELIMSPPAQSGSKG